MNYFWQDIPPERRLYRVDEKIIAGFIPHSYIVGMDVNNFQKTEFVNGEKIIKKPEQHISTTTKIPYSTKGFYAYLGARSKEFVKSLTSSGATENLLDLEIGWQEENKDFLRNFSLKDNFDYSSISQELSRIYFPNLLNFSFGFDELFVNQDMLYGILGDMTQVLENMPKLEKLWLCGIFELDSPTKLEHLVELNIDTFWVNSWLDVVEKNDLSETTFTNIFLSNLPNLEKFILALKTETNESKVYSIPENIYALFPKLKFLRIEGFFEKGTKEKLQKELGGRIEYLFLEEIVEV
ncbi:MAG: hypothetical protein DI598_06065 [Pseudopedobacter saltans]|uniref:Leucine-rich repeat domain-containing protein n=1 Tax=Pseudopedobacter saltans TaxID=151895 RepID=A0A2W5F200_9SPHI|nr:MAG: hypothetical protein DI598_06065 [Pseudopedobacter saltans]